jgi:hypothetical protein
MQKMSVVNAERKSLNECIYLATEMFNPWGVVIFIRFRIAGQR